MNKKLMEAMEYMEQKYIDEAVEPRRASYKPLMRWGTIAACLVLVVGLCIGFLGGVPAQPDGSEPQLNHPQPSEPDGTAATAPHTDGIILPPNRLSADGGKLLFKYISFQDLIEEADAIAWVRVGNWLGERTGDMIWDTTFYAAEVIECYKGNLGSSIVLEQSGASTYTLKGYPLFTHGNEFLVFLHGGAERTFREEGYVGIPFESSFCVLGEYTTLMDVATTADGETYAISRRGGLGDEIQECIANLSVKHGVRKNVCSVLADVDTVQQRNAEHSQYIFSIDALAELFE